MILIQDCPEIVLMEKGPKTKDIGEILREYIYEALKENKPFKAGRYQNFLALALKYVTAASLPSDMEAFERSNQVFLDSIKNNWQAYFLHLSRFDEDFSHNLNVTVSEEQTTDFLARIRHIIGDDTQNHVEEARGLFKEYRTHHQDDLFVLEALYQKAWTRVKEVDAPSTIRERFNHTIRKCFRMEMIKRLLATPDMEAKIRASCQWGFLTGVKFEDPLLPPSLETIRENAQSLLIESFVFPAWTTIYQNYLKYVKDKPVYLSADELLCLAKYWNVQLQINFQNSTLADKRLYRSYREPNAALLTVVLCNPSQGHWLVEIPHVIQAQPCTPAYDSSRQRIPPCDEYDREEALSEFEEQNRGRGNRPKACSIQ